MPDLIASLLVTTSLLFFLGGASVLIYRTPIIITFSGVWKENTRSGSVCIRWGPCAICVSPGTGGLQAVIRIRGSDLYRLPMQSSQRDQKSQAGPAPVSPEETEPKKDLQRLFSYIPLIQKIIPLFFTHVRIETVIGTVRFGAGDPVTTALVYGYYHALTPLFRIFCTAVLIPVFDQLMFEADLTGGFRIVCPAGLIIRSIRKIFPDILPMLNTRMPTFVKMGGTCG